MPLSSDLPIAQLTSLRHLGLVRCSSASSLACGAACTAWFGGANGGEAVSRALHSSASTAESYVKRWKNKRTRPFFCRSTQGTRRYCGSSRWRPCPNLKISLPKGITSMTSWGCRPLCGDCACRYAGGRRTGGG